MLNPDDHVLYWTNTFHDLFSKWKTFIAENAEEVNKYKTRRSSVFNKIVTEKPDNISEDIWDNFFIKDASHLKAATNLLSRYFYGFKPEDSKVYYCCIRNFPSVCFLLSEAPSSVETISGSIMVSAYRNSNFDIINQNVDKIRLAYNVLKAIYGDENVKLSYKKYDPYISTFAGLSVIKPCFFIRHKDFWCEDQYDLRCKISSGISAMRVNDNGKISGNPKFGVSYPDQLYHQVGYRHSHVPSNTYNDAISLGDICRGSGSPINTAKQVMYDQYTDEHIFNFFFNYNNLLSKEDEQGTPHCRMRRYLLKSANSSEHSNRSMQFDDLKEGLRDGVIDVIVDVEDGGFSVKLDEDTISKYLEQNQSSGNTIRHKSSGGVYKSEVNNFSSSPKVYYEVPFNSQIIKVGICQHDPDIVDLSRIPESRHWSTSLIEPPTPKTITAFNLKINSIANAKVISQYETKNIKSAEIIEELVGLRNLERNTNVEDFISTAQPD